MTNDERIARACDAFREAHDRFTTRLRGATTEEAERPPADGGWSAAAIAWHVAAVNTAFAAVLSGERKAAPLPDGFVDRPWSDIVPAIPGRIEAIPAVVPPEGVRIADALAARHLSARRLEDALRTLTPERGTGFGITHPAVGTINLYQVGDFAAAHVRRHNAQAKRVLGR
jgi:hypothetical protein